MVWSFAFVNPLDALGFVLTGLYVLMLILIGVYGIHRYWLTYLYWRHRREAPSPAGAFDDDHLPRVTVQLPMFNEGPVAERIIDAAAKLDYPADRLQVQVLDDSTDDSAGLAQRRVGYWRGRGIDIDYIHRTDRQGYKAGALDAGMAKASGELVAIFDADFVPPSGFLRQTVDHFTDREIGMVQSRWGHLNGDNSMLTRAQAVFLDGHFAVEQAARNRSGRWFHFNGTAGLWRAAAIHEAGGWSAGTLCEDLDLSIRAQLAGWKFRYLQDVVCPAELPPVVSAFQNQQYRWFKGTVQVALKLLPTVLRSPATWRVKSELLAQLLCPFVSIALVAFSVGYYPAVAYAATKGFPAVWTAGTLITGLIAGAFFYIVSQKIVGRGLLYGLLMIPVMISAGIGISLTNARGIFEALAGMHSPFVRTPKFNDGPGRRKHAAVSGGAAGSAKSKAGSKPTVGSTNIKPAEWMMPLLALVIAAYLAVCLIWSFGDQRTLGCVPLLILFVIGYAWFGGASLCSVLQKIEIAPAKAESEPENAQPVPLGK